MALQDQMSWETFVSLMDDLAPTLHKFKLLNTALLDVVKKLKIDKENDSNSNDKNSKTNLQD